MKSLACCVVTFHAESRHGLLTVMCWLLRVVRVVCDGCDWIAGCKSGAFSSVGLAMKSLACCVLTFHAKESARFADGDVLVACVCM